MSVTIPVYFYLLPASGGGHFASALPIKYDIAGGITTYTLVRNATHVYGYANRRTLASFGCIGHVDDAELTARNPILTASATYETVFEVPATLSADTDRIQFVAWGKGITIQITAWGTTAKGTSRAVLTAARASGSEGAMTHAAGPQSISGDESLTLEVEIKRTGAQDPAELYLLRVYEVPLQSAELP